MSTLNEENGLDTEAWLTFKPGHLNHRESQGKDQFKISQGQLSKYQTKELSFCPISLQPNVVNLTTSGWIDIGTRKFEFVTITQLLWL